jgi:hypothetical protein
MDNRANPTGGKPTAIDTHTHFLPPSAVSPAEANER